MAWLGLERNTLRRDLAIAGACLLSGLLLLALSATHLIEPFPGYPRALFLVPLMVVVAAVALRRVATAWGLGIGVLGFLADLAIGGSLATLMIFTQVVYDSTVYGRPRLWRGLLAGSIATTLATAAVGLVLTRSWQGLGLGVLPALAIVLPVVTGLSVRQYREQAAAERARAEQTARLAESGRRQAVLAERARMARELHDVIANHLSAVALHTTAVLSVPGLDKPTVDRSLRVIRENSVQGLAEMRRMVELLRDAPADLVHLGLSDVDDLAARAGGPVRVSHSGPPVALPSEVDAAAYRIVQESITNALKHGDGTGAEVTVEYLPGAVRLGIVSRGAAPAARVPGAGMGLVGMRERAELLGGSFDAGPCPSGTWRVTAELPLIGRALDARA